MKGFDFYNWDFFYWYVGLGVLLLTLLGMNISRLRISNKVANGDGGNLEIKKAIQAHGNAIEHVLPYGMAVLVLTHMRYESTVLGILVFGFLSLRLLHAYSMVTSAFNLRRVSASTTYLFELAACVLIFNGIYQA